MAVDVKLMNRYGRNEDEEVVPNYENALKTEFLRR